MDQPSVSVNEVRALLLTDVVDSTKMSEALGDTAMAVVWAAHDRVARDLLPVFGGLEIDKTDGMLLMFKTASEAVQYAVAYHRALAGLETPLKARAGLHVGPVILRNNAAEDVARGAKPIEVDGLAKPTAARVMSLAQGGQTLITSDAYAVLGATELQTMSHGHWVMKGISEPMELFEIGGAESPFEAPPDSEKVYRVVLVGERWLPVKEIPNNLPNQTTTFFGRTKELADLKAALNKSRLVTLLGMGGLGKTRLSLQVGAEVMPAYTDGVWFLDLTTIQDAAVVVNETAQVFGVREEPGRPLLQSLCAHLNAQRVLLIIDNCEHLMDASAKLVNALLRGAPQMRILTSSREALRVPGEQVYPVKPLPVPKPGDNVEALLKSTAVRLFMERAQLHKPSFELTTREAPAVAELVARLEGIPLALELAAARVRSMSVSDINLRLKDRYKLLTGGGRVLQERQQTLRALVDWSYDMLSENERLVLNRIAIFIGGFDLKAAETVCGAEPLSDFDVLDVLASLVEKSLVMLDEQDGDSRYRTLEMIRDYAWEKLEQSGELPETAERHCQYFFAFTKEGSRGLIGGEAALWTRRMEADLDNLRAVIRLATNGGTNAIIAVKMAVAMQGFWVLRGYATEGRAVVRAALAMESIKASEMAQAFALYVGAALASTQSDYVEARSMLETCLTLRRQLGNPIEIAATLSTLTLSLMAVGDLASARVGETEALQIFQEQKDAQGEALGLLHLGQIDFYEGHDAQARAHLEQGLTLSRTSKIMEIESECELLLGEIAMEAGDWTHADQRFQRALAICGDSGDARGHARAQWYMAKNTLHLGDMEAARTQFTNAIRIFRRFEMREELLGSLEDFAKLDCSRGQWARGARTLSIAGQMRVRAGIVRHQRAEAALASLLESLKRNMPPEEFQAAWDEGRGIEAETALMTTLIH